MKGYICNLRKELGIVSLPINVFTGLSLFVSIYMARRIPPFSVSRFFAPTLAVPQIRHRPLRSVLPLPASRSHGFGFEDGGD